MTKNRFPTFDPRHEEDQSALAGLVAEGEKVGNIKDPEVAAEVQNMEDWNNWIESDLRRIEALTEYVRSSSVEYSRPPKEMLEEDLRESIKLKMPLLEG